MAHTHKTRDSKHGHVVFFLFLFDNSPGKQLLKGVVKFPLSSLPFQYLLRSISRASATSLNLQSTFHHFFYFCIPQKSFRAVLNVITFSLLYRLSCASSKCDPSSSLEGSGSRPTKMAPEVDTTDSSPSRQPRLNPPPISLVRISF